MARSPLLVGALLLAGVAGAAPVPSTARVSVLDGALQPATAQILAGGTVTWVNEGRKRHTIASDSRAWRTFALAPRAEKTIRFGRAGTYPYRLDGRHRGRVVVLASGTGGATGGERVFRYDVSVRGHYEYIGTVTGGREESNGRVHFVIDWRGVWRNVAVKVNKYGGTGLSVVLDPQRAAKGTIDSDFRFTQTIAKDGGPCEGAVPDASYPADMLVSGFAGARAPTTVRFSSQLELAAGSKRADAIRSTYRFFCRGKEMWPAGLSWPKLPYPMTVKGVVVRPPGGLNASLLETAFERKSAKGVPFPLDRLRDGEPFSLDSGRKTAAWMCFPGCLVEQEGSITIRFVRKR